MRAICRRVFSVIIIQSELAICEEVKWFLARVVSFPITKIAKVDQIDGHISNSICGFLASCCNRLTWKAG